VSGKLSVRKDHMVRMDVYYYLITNVILLQNFINLLSDVLSAVAAIKLREQEQF